MKIPHLRIILVFVVLAAASLACNFPADSASPTAAPTPIPMSTEEIQQLEEQIQSTLANPSSTGEVTITITEQQLNGYIAAKIAEDDQQLITNPRLELTNGQVIVYGQVSQSGITADTKITTQPRVDENGSPKLDVLSIDLGPFPVPQALSDRVEGMVDNALADYLSTSSNRFTVTSIVVVEDQMTVTGIPQ